MASVLPRTTVAAVLFELGQPLELVELELPSLQAGQVLVEVAYTGICHSQLNEARGRKGPDRFLPHAMGHEGSGRVLAVGPEVTKVVPGDDVVLTWIKGSGAEVASVRYASPRGTINAGAIATFMYHTVTCESRVVRLPKEFPMREAALLGCAIPSGGGIVLNTGGVKPGVSVAVFGVGGIGAAAVAVAATLGASPLVAIDILPAKLALARRLGATHTLDGQDPGIIDRLREITAGGADLAIEAAGVPSVMEAAFSSVRTGGGLCVLAGNVAFGEKISVDPYDLIKGRRIVGSWGGETEPDTDILRYADMALAGRINLADMISAEYKLPDINQALDALEAGKVARAIIKLSTEIT